MDSRSIKFSPATIEELRRALSEPADNEVESETDQSVDLDFPWPITIVSQGVSTGDDGGQVINVTLGFESVEGAEDYEVRIALVPEVTSFWDGMSPFTSWARNGAATLITGGTEVQLHSTAGSTSGSIISPEFVPSGWSVIDITITMLISGGGDGWEVTLWDAATHGTTELAAAGTKYSRVFDDLWVASNNTNFKSNDGTTNINYVVGGNTARSGFEDTTRFVWTKTGANTASVSTYRNGVLQISSPGDLWVPDTARIGIWGFNGLLSSHQKIIKAVTVYANG
jgi:hypothetical protein